MTNMWPTFSHWIRKSPPVAQQPRAWGTCNSPAPVFLSVPPPGSLPLPSDPPPPDPPNAPLLHARRTRPMNLSGTNCRCPLTPEERQQCFNQILCLFCGGNNHRLAACPIRPARTLRGTETLLGPLTTAHSFRLRKRTCPELNSGPTLDFPPRSTSLSAFSISGFSFSDVSVLENTLEGTYLVLSCMLSIQFKTISTNAPLTPEPPDLPSSVKNSLATTPLNFFSGTPPVSSKSSTGEQSSQEESPVSPT